MQGPCCAENVGFRRIVATFASGFALIVLMGPLQNTLGCHHLFSLLGLGHPLREIQSVRPCFGAVHFRDFSHGCVGIVTAGFPNAPRMLGQCLVTTLDMMVFTSVIIMLPTHKMQRKKISLVV